MSHQNEKHPSLVTVKEVADYLSVKPKTLYQWAEIGQIPCVKLNGCVRFDLEDIKKWVQDCKIQRGSGISSKKF